AWSGAALTQRSLGELCTGRPDRAVYLHLGAATAEGWQADGDGALGPRTRHGSWQACRQVVCRQCSGTGTQRPGQLRRTSPHCQNHRVRRFHAGIYRTASGCKRRLRLSGCGTRRTWRACPLGCGRCRAADECPGGNRSHHRSRVVACMSDLAWLTARPIAHRGLHDLNRTRWENTRAAFQAAIDHGFAIECDVHLTADRVPVVFHDSDLSRLTGCQGQVWQHTAAELAEFVIGGTEERISSLVKVLDL